MTRVYTQYCGAERPTCNATQAVQVQQAPAHTSISIRAGLCPIPSPQPHPPFAVCRPPLHSVRFTHLLSRILAIFIANIFIVFTVMIYFRPTLQKVQSFTRDAFFILDSAVHRITGTTVILANAKSSLSRVLSLSLPALAGSWMNVTQESASQVLSKLTSAQVSLLAGTAALEGSEHIEVHFLTNSTSVLQLLLAEIADKESRIKAKGADVALRYVSNQSSETLTHCHAPFKGFRFCLSEHVMCSCGLTCSSDRRAVVARWRDGTIALPKSNSMIWNILLSRVRCR